MDIYDMNVFQRGLLNKSNTTQSVIRKLWQTIENMIIRSIWLIRISHCIRTAPPGMCWVFTILFVHWLVILWNSDVEFSIRHSYCLYLRKKKLWTTSKIELVVNLKKKKTVFSDNLRSRHLSVKKAFQNDAIENVRKQTNKSEYNWTSIRFAFC